MKRFALLFLALFIGWSTTATAQNGNYLIQPGDTLSIEVIEDESLNRNVLVLPDGQFSFPTAGTIRAGGRTISQVQRAVTAGITDNFLETPTVTVSVVSVSTPEEALEEEAVISLYVLGEVNTPGLIEAQPGTTFLQALSLSGGLTRFAATKRIQLRRIDPRTGASRLYNINYRAIINGAQINRDAILTEGDVIIVPERRLFE